MTTDRIPVLAIVNTSEEITQLLAAVFQMEGFRTISGYVLDFKRGNPDFGAFVTENQPDVVLWDIAMPYEENWAYFQSVRQSEVVGSLPFVLTTTNKRALEDLVGPTPTHEIIGKPYDLEQVVEAVRRVLGRE